MDELERLKLELNSRGFSRKTKKSYLSFAGDFLEYSGKEPGKTKEKDVKKYISHLAIDKGYTNTTLNLAISALKFFYGEVLGSNVCDNIRRPKREKHLPTVLSGQEIKRIINSANNTKHRLVLSCLYGMGLRVSEIVDLRVENLDFERGMAKVSGKGGKERYVMIPKKLETDLEKYIELGGLEDYLFPGRKGKYSIKSVQKIFEYASKKAGIKKNVSCHTMRHSFATHLLEKGVSIRYIQSLLGHSRLQTTQIYTKVANGKLKNIKSPLDDLGD